MNAVKSVLNYANLLSLDVVLGAMAGMKFFADLLEVNLSILVYILLGMAVWCIYTLDHLWDAKSISGKASTKRHVFHQKHFFSLLFLWIGVVLIGLFMVGFVKEVKFLIIPGMIIGGIAVAVMLLVRFGFKEVTYLKEITTALIYVVGIAFVPYHLQSSGSIPLEFYQFAINYFLLAFLNLLILSFMDKESDENDHFGSVLKIITVQQLNKVIFILGLLLISILFTQFWVMLSYFHIYTGIVLVMGLIHMMAFLRLGIQKEVRMKLEATFLIPFLLFLF